MESIDLRMDDLHDGIFDDDEAEEFPPLPPMPSLSPRRQDDDEDGVVSQAWHADGNADAVHPALDDMPAARAARRINRNPQPKLDANRLTNGERGIAVIPQEFAKLKFKGKGHEAADLKLMMQKYEHWAHRLFPQMPFDDVIEKIEQLGNKKPVQVCMKKIRLDMPLTDEDYGRGREEEENEVDDENTDLVSMVTRNPSQSPSQTRIPTEDNQFSQTTPASPVISRPPPSSQPTPGTTPTTQASLSEEQLERIERNKRLAREKRAARMRAMQSPAPVSQNQEASQPTPTETSDAVVSPVNEQSNDVTTGDDEVLERARTGKDGNTKASDGDGECSNADSAADTHTVSSQAEDTASALVTKPHESKQGESTLDEDATKSGVGDSTEDMEVGNENVQNNDDETVVESQTDGNVTQPDEGEDVQDMEVGTESVEDSEL